MIIQPIFAQLWFWPKATESDLCAGPQFGVVNVATVKTLVDVDRDPRHHHVGSDHECTRIVFQGGDSVLVVGSVERIKPIIELVVREAVFQNT